MRSYERSGIVVDQCSECRGIFLDRGELEKLVDAVAAYGAGPWVAAAAVPPGPGGPPRVDERYRGDDRYRGDEKYRDEKYRDDRYDKGYDPRRKKQKSFLEEFFG